MPLKAVAVLRNDSGKVGTIYFDQSTPCEPVKVTGQISGLEAGEHGFHIHEFGDTTNGCISAGPHFNIDPKNHHGGPVSAVAHNGDLGNVVADDKGVANIDINHSRISLTPGDQLNVVGRTVVCHQKRDDLGLGGDEESLKTGNAGGRWACGVIGLAKA